MPGGILRRLDVTRVMMVERLREELSRIGMCVACNLFRCSGGDDEPATVSAFRTKIDDPVSGLDDVEIVLDHQNRSPAVDQFAERGEQLLNIVEVQAGRGFVEDIQDALVCLRGEMRGKLQALRLASGERRRGLSQTQVAEAHFIENAQLGNDFRDARKIDRKSVV